MNILICGSREDFDKEKAEDYLKEFIRSNRTDTFIHGGAKGVDTLADRILLKFECHIERMIPDYDIYGRRATIIRNRAMVMTADRVIAFWNFKSRGTKYTIDYARVLQIPVDIVDVRISVGDKNRLGV